MGEYAMKRHSSDRSRLFKINIYQIHCIKISRYRNAVKTDVIFCASVDRHRCDTSHYLNIILYLLQLHITECNMLNISDTSIM